MMRQRLAHWHLLDSSTDRRIRARAKTAPFERRAFAQRPGRVAHLPGAKMKTSKCRYPINSINIQPLAARNNESSGPTLQKIIRI
jgi:hypothetical protein